ncbi:MAG TPA: type IV toxin-antitoxin system AbiEi family antitoxin domain-containing protein [Solirubrobacterales bacterium]
MPYKGDTVDAEVARIAGRQHGVVTAKQLNAAGWGRMAISERSRSGRLHRIHQGVYAVGHRGLSLHGRFMAAVLACGEGAVLSHGSAAVLWNLLRPLEGPIHVSIPSASGRKRRRGIQIHRTPSLAEPSPSPSSTKQGGGRGRRLLTTYRANIPTTTVSRTIEDLEGYLPSHLVRRATRQAEFMGLNLEGIETDRTRSDLESAFLALIHDHRLPPPEVNAKLGRHEVDFLWHSVRLVVETDGFTYHRGAIAFEDDRARDLDLRAAGYTVLRFSGRQLDEEPGRVVGDVARALAEEGLSVTVG